MKYKMLLGLLFTLVPGLVSARISIHVNASSQEGKASVELLGSAIDILSNLERITFKINDDELKRAVEIVSGEPPNDCWLRSPTPEGSLHQMYSWKEVQRTLIPQNANIVSIHAHPVIVDFQEYCNNGSDPHKYDVGIKQELQYSASSAWIKSCEISVSEDNFYRINFVLDKVNNGSSMSYTAQCGEENLNMASVVVESSFEVELVPGQSVISTLYAYQGTMKVEVDYTSSLDGNVACVFQKPDGNQYIPFDIDKVMKAGGIPTTVELREVLTIDFYSDAWNTLVDVNANVIFRRKTVDLPVGRLAVVYDETNDFMGDVRIINV